MLRSGMPLTVEALSGQFPSRTVSAQQIFEPGQQFRVNANSFSRNEGVPNGGPIQIGGQPGRDILANIDDGMFSTLLAQQANQASSVTTQTAAAQDINVQIRGYAGDGYNPAKSSRKEILCTVYPMKSREETCTYGSFAWVNVNCINSNASARAAIEKVQMSETTREAHERSLHVYNNGLAGSKRKHVDEQTLESSQNVLTTLREDPFFVWDLNDFRKTYHMHGYSISSENERVDLARTQYGARIINTRLQGRTGPVTNIFGDVCQGERVGFLIGTPGMGTGKKARSWKDRNPVMMMPYRSKSRRVPVASSLRPLHDFFDDQAQMEAKRNQLKRPDGTRFDFLGETDPATRLPYVGLTNSVVNKGVESEAFYLLDQLVSPDTGYISAEELGQQNDLAYRDVAVFFMRAPPKLSVPSPVSDNPFDPAKFGVFRTSGIYTQHVIESCIVCPLGIVLFPVEGTAYPTSQEVGRCMTDPQGNAYHLSRSKCELVLSVT